MRRTSALFLLFLFGVSLIGPVVFADAGSQLPACCRRGGKHHCTTGNLADQRDSSSGPALQAPRPQCAEYPNGGAVPVHANPLALKSAETNFALVLSHPAVQAQTEARYRTSFSRSHQKRGPPILPS